MAERQPQQLVKDWRDNANASLTTIREGRTLDNCADELEASLARQQLTFHGGEGTDHGISDIFPADELAITSGNRVFVLLYTEPGKLTYSVMSRERYEEIKAQRQAEWEAKNAPKPDAIVGG